MTRKTLISFLLILGLIGTSLLVVYSIRTQRQEIRKQAAEEFRQLYFTYTSTDPNEGSVNNYEAIMSYKFEYPKFIWRFDKLTCGNDRSLVQRRFLHIGKTAEEVVREGWIDHSFFEWSPGDPLPSGEVNIPLDKGCFFQFDATLTIKPRYGQTSTERNGIDKGDSGTIDGCALVPTVQPTPTPTRSIPPTATPTQRPVSTSTPTRAALTPTATIRPSVTPTPSAGPSPTASVTPLISSTPKPTVTNQPEIPTPTNSPKPTTTVIPGQSYCEYLVIDKSSGDVPLLITFKGKGNDSTRVKGFRFTFGDSQNQEVLGSYSSDYVQEATHSYTKTGTYIATLEILDNGDHWKTRDECKVTITVTQKLASNETTPTEAQLPSAGIKIPTLGAIIAGFLLISIGLAFVF